MHFYAFYPCLFTLIIFLWFFFRVIVLKITPSFQAGSYILDLLLLFIQMQRERLLNLSGSLYLNYLSPDSFDTSCVTHCKTEAAALCHCIH